MTAANLLTSHIAKASNAVEDVERGSSLRA